MRVRYLTSLEACATSARTGPDGWRNRASSSSPRSPWRPWPRSPSACSLTACENVTGFTQPTLVRVIDASYIAPAINVTVEGTTLAANIGQGAITPYGTLQASIAAPIKVTAATGGTTLVSATGTLLAGHQHSVFITDNGVAPLSYTVTVLEDQQITAASNHSAFRFLNQAPKTGAVDIYMIPAGITLANTIPLVTNLPVGATAGYISFTRKPSPWSSRPPALKRPLHIATPCPYRRRSAHRAHRRHPADLQPAR